MSKAYMDADSSETGVEMAWAVTAGQARRIFADRYECDFTDVRVQRVPWMDGFEHADESDVIMAGVRQGWYANVGEYTSLDVYDRMEKAGMLDSDGYLDLKSEEQFKAFAGFIGAKYPDKYKPKEERS